MLEDQTAATPIDAPPPPTMEELINVYQLELATLKADALAVLDAATKRVATATAELAAAQAAKENVTALLTAIGGMPPA
jgi:hypothetical protein